MSRRHHLVARAIALAVLVGAPGAANAAPLRPEGRATVLSVDGPGALTIRAGKRTLRVRLHFVDLPKPGECGATEATAALRGFVARARGLLRYELVQSYRDRQRRLVRARDGRYPAAITYHAGLRELGGDLIAADWARPGTPLADTPALRDAEGVTLSDDLPGRRGDDEAPRPRRGIWALCGGRLHLPIGAPVPATAAAPWAVDVHGVTSTVGPISLSPTLTPGGALTLAQLTEIAPTEITRFGWGCRAWLPSLQIRVWVGSDRDDCSPGYVAAMRTAGPDPAPLARGGSVGEPASALPARFPLVSLSGRSRGARLSGPQRPQWAWQTEALIGTDGRLTGLAAYAAPAAPTT